MVLLLYALLVLAASLYPEAPRWAAAAGSDRLAHFAAYVLLGVLLAVGLGAPARIGWRRCLVALLLGACYGAALEVAQRFTGRAPELGDAVANLLGVAAGAGSATLVSRVRRGAG